jgi:ligand-binding sensor domain-containing protein
MSVHDSRQANGDVACSEGPNISARGLAIDRHNRLWLGGDAHIAIWTLDASGNTTGTPTSITGSWTIRRLVSTSEGMMAATDGGQVIALSGNAPEVLFAVAEGTRINDVVEDAAHNLWVGTTRGLVSLRRQGITLYSTRQGLRQPALRTITRDARGHLYAFTEDEWIHKVEGSRLSSVRLAMPAGVRRSLWSSASVRVDRAGDIWLGTANGLFRYANPRFSPDRSVEESPDASYTVADGLSGNHIGRIFEDSQGNIWIASMSRNDTLTVWRRQSSMFERIGTSAGFPASNQPSEFVEDGHGAVWVLLREGGVARIRGGRATLFGVDHGFPALVTASYVDRRGDLWFGGQDKLVRVLDPTSDSVRASAVLSRIGSTVLALAQDRSGAIFIGTYDGLLAFDPVGGAVRRFSSFEGLPQGNVAALAEDADGALLIVAGQLLARLEPWAAARLQAPPRCLVTAVRVGGRPIPLPESGLEQLVTSDLLPTQNQIEVEFLALSRRLGEPLIYKRRWTGSAIIPPTSRSSTSSSRACPASTASGCFGRNSRKCCC